jgi:cell division transport system permease protein
MQKITHHIRSFNQAWLSIFKQPIEHLINIVVLALIISICALGISLHNNLAIWQQQNITYPQIMMYLDKTANQADVANIEKVLTGLSKTSVRNYQFISKQQGLAELQQDQQLKSIASDVIDQNNNPLPDILIVNTATSESATLQHLNMQLSQLPMVDNVQVDMNYAGKVSDLIGFTSKVTMFAQILFIVVLALVVYNMIRLQMLIKSEAVQVSRLIGASDSFIMRPLIHYAVWQVSLATVIAGGTVYYLTNTINALFANFSNLFGKNLHFAQLVPLQLFALWIVLVVFTIFTVFLAVRWVFHNTYTNK